MYTWRITANAVILLGLAHLAYGCDREIKEDFPVTYEVNVRSTIKQKIHIIYIDSTGCKSLITDSNWQKKVTLPPGTMAMLTVYPIITMNSQLNEQLQHRRKRLHAVWQTKIIHKEKTVEKVGSNLSISSIRLTQRGIALNRRKWMGYASPLLPLI